MKYEITHIDDSGVVVDIYLSDDDIRTHKITGVNVNDKEELVAQLTDEVTNIVTEINRLNPELVDGKVKSLVGGTMELQSVKQSLFSKIVGKFK